MQIVSPGGIKYFMTCKDDASCYTELYFLCPKNEAVTKFKGLTSCVFLILFLNLIYYSFILHILGMAAKLRTRFNRGVEIFRTDGGGEWIGKEFQQWLQNEGVVHHTTAPYTPP